MDNTKSLDRIKEASESIVGLTIEKRAIIELWALIVKLALRVEVLEEKLNKKI